LCAPNPAGFTKLEPEPNNLATDIVDHSQNWLYSTAFVTVTDFCLVVKKGWVG
jgi:hypothetical protein